MIDHLNVKYLLKVEKVAYTNLICTPQSTLQLQIVSFNYKLYNYSETDLLIDQLLS